MISNLPGRGVMTTRLLASSLIQRTNEIMGKNPNNPALHAQTLRHGPSNHHGGPPIAGGYRRDGRLANVDSEMTLHSSRERATRPASPLSTTIEPAQSRHTLRRCHSSVDWLGRACCVIAIGGFSWATHSASQGIESQKPRELSVAAGAGLEENAGRQVTGTANVASSLHSTPSAETLWKRVFGSGWGGARLRPTAVAQTSSKDGKVGFRVGNIGIASTAEARADAKVGFRVGNVGIASTAEARANGVGPAFRVTSVASTLDALTSVKIGYSDSVARSNTYARSVMRDDPDMPGPNFYQSHPEAFSQLDQFLGYTYERSGSTSQDGRERNLSMSLGIDSGLAISNFDPTRSMLKLGPIYLDVTSVEAGVLWTNYHGSPQFTAGFAKPGWAAYVQTGFRVVGRLTDTLYIAAGGSIVYLPWRHRWAFDAGYGTGGPNAGLSLLYANHFGEWDVSLYERFNAYSGLGYYLRHTEPGSDQVGRYLFGVPYRGGGNNVFTEDLVYWSNHVGAAAKRPVFDGNWLLSLSMDHYDYWRSFDFSDHGVQDRAEIRLGYTGSNIPFAPYAYYRVADPDGIGYGTDFLYHQVGVGVNGHLTEDIMWDADAGLVFYSGSDDTRNGHDVTWNVGFSHRVTANLMQGLRFGQGLFSSDIFKKTVLADYVSYDLQYRLARRSWLKAFVQYTDREFDLVDGSRRRDLRTGTVVTLGLSELTSFEGTVYLERTFDAPVNSLNSQWVYRASLIQYLTRKLSATVFFQYEDDSGRGAGFHEQVAGFSLRQLF